MLTVDEIHALRDRLWTRFKVGQDRDEDLYVFQHGRFVTIGFHGIYRMPTARAAKVAGELIARFAMGYCPRLHFCRDEIHSKGGDVLLEFTVDPTPEPRRNEGLLGSPPDLTDDDRLC